MIASPAYPSGQTIGVTSDTINDTTDATGDSTDSTDETTEAEDTADDTTESTEDTTDDTEDTIDDTTESTDETTDEAEDTADDTTESTDDTTDEAEDTAEDTTESTEDTTGDTSDSAQDTTDSTDEPADDRGDSSAFGDGSSAGADGDEPAADASNEPDEPPDSEANETVNSTDDEAVASTNSTDDTLDSSPILLAGRDTQDSSQFIPDTPPGADAGILRTAAATQSTDVATNPFTEATDHRDAVIKSATPVDSVATLTEEPVDSLSVTGITDTPSGSTLATLTSAVEHQTETLTNTVEEATNSTLSTLDTITESVSEPLTTTLDETVNTVDDTTGTLLGDENGISDTANPTVFTLTEAEYTAPVIRSPNRLGTPYAASRHSEDTASQPPFSGADGRANLGDAAAVGIGAILVAALASHVSIASILLSKLQLMATMGSAWMTVIPFAKFGWGMRFWLWRVFSLLRYSRHDGSDPLEHETRSTLYEWIEASPGVHLTGLSEATNVPLSTVRYHVRILEHENLVTSTITNGKRRFHPATANERDHPAIHSDAAGPIIEVLADNGPLGVSAIASRLDRDPSTVTHHLQRLADAGVIERTRDGRKVINHLAPDARVGLVGDPDEPVDAPVTGSAD